MRIDTSLSEDDSEDVQNLADKMGFQKPKAYAKLVRTGLEVQERRETIKQYIVDFFEEEKPRYEERLEELKTQYGIEEVNWDDNRMFVVYKGDQYEFPGDPSDLVMINGEGYKKRVCPECGSEDTEYNFDDYEEMDDDSAENYSCNECGVEFDRLDTKYSVPKEDIDHVKEFSWRQYQLHNFVVGQLREILDAAMGPYSGGRCEYLHPGTYQYRNGFQVVSIPMWCTDKEGIRFNREHSISSYEDIRNPLSLKAKRNLVDDYLQLVREIRAANPDAEKVRPIYIDSRGKQLDVIEVVGQDVDDTSLPFRTVGYELEKEEPSEEDLAPEHDITLEHEEGEPVAWLRVVNDKRIELPQEYKDTDEYYLAISADSLNPIHLVDCDTEEPYCSEEIEELTTDDDRLNDDEPVVRKGICSSCLDEVENFGGDSSGQ